MSIDQPSNAYSKDEIGIQLHRPPECRREQSYGYRSCRRSKDAIALGNTEMMCAQSRAMIELTWLSSEHISEVQVLLVCLVGQGQRIIIVINIAVSRKRISTSVFPRKHNAQRGDQADSQPKADGRCQKSTLVACQQTIR